MSGLEGFSDWTLALLPRLFLYPGGVWLLAALLGLRVTSGGWSAVRPQALVRDLSRASLLALAVAWAASSLVPLPAASPLSSQVDTFALVALLVASLALDEVKRGASGWREGWVSIGMALAVLAPAVQGRTLLGYVSTWNISSVLSMVCVGVGLIALSVDTGRHLPGAVRWLGWLGLGFAPVLAGWPQVPGGGFYWTSLIYALSIATLVSVGRFVASYTHGRKDVVVAVVCVLATLSLLATLVGY